MEFSTEATQAMAEMMVAEIERIGLAAGNIQEIENGMREMLKGVGAAALGQALESRDQQENGHPQRSCACQGEQQLLFRRQAKVVSVFGRVSYRRRYFRCRDRDFA